MNSGKRLCKTLQANQKAYYQHLEDSYSFPKDGNKGLLLEREANYLQSIISHQRALDMSIIGLERSSYAYMMYMYYALWVLDDKELAYSNLGYTNAYSLLSLKVEVSTIKCFTHVPVSQESMALHIVLMLLDEEMQVVSDYIHSIKDIKLNPSLAFILSLYQKYSNENIIHTEQNNHIFYNKILTAWDSTNTQEINYHINLLCEAHLDLTKETQFHSNPLLQLFPYEILAWLKLREQAGHKNPKTFSPKYRNIGVR